MMHSKETLFSSSHSKGGNSTTHKKLVRLHHQIKSLGHSCLKCPKLSATTLGLSATNNNKSPGLLLTLAKILFNCSSVKNLHR